MTCKTENKKIYLFLGEDEFRRKSAYEELIAKTLLPEEYDYSLEKYSCVDSSVDACLEALQTQSLFGEKKVVLIEGLMQMLSQLPEKESTWWDVLEKSMMDNITLIIIENSIDKRRTGYKKLSKLAQIKEFENWDDSKKFDRQSIEEFCLQKVKAFHKEIKTDAMNYLIDSVGGQTRCLDMELSKIDLFLGDSCQVISKEHCEKLVSQTKEALVYEISDAISEKDLGRVLLINKKLTIQKESPQVILAMLGNFYRLLIQACSIIKDCPQISDMPVYYSQKGMASWLKSAEDQLGAMQVLKQHPYRSFKLFSAAKQKTMTECVEGFRLIVQTIHLLQSTTQPRDHLMEMLFVKLCR